MSRILIAYGTRTGTAEEVSGTIANVLADHGAEVKVLPARDVKDVDGYDAVVLGTAVRVGRLMPEVVRLAKANRERLSGVPVALFLVCRTMREDTDETRQRASEFLAPLRELVTPVSEGLFGGAVRPKRTGLIARLALRLVKAPKGDFRNWDAIRAWATDVAPKLAGGNRY